MKMLPILLSTTVLSIALFSCKPEPPEKQPGTVDPGQTDTTQTDTGPTDTSQISKNLLGKVELTSGSDVTTKLYQYDAQNRLVWYSNTSTKAGYFEDTSKIIRAADGHIAQIVYSSDTSSKFNDPKVDSIVYNVHYDAASSQYTYKLVTYKNWNYTFKDSSAYTYDAQGHIVREDAYYFDYQYTKAYQPATKRELTYDGSGNVTSLATVYYKVDGVNDYPYSFTYTYGDKDVNLLNLGNEAVIIGLEENFSAHNPLTMTSSYPQDPQYNRSLTYKYTYNTKYRPLRADVTDAATNTQSTLVYTYQ